MIKLSKKIFKVPVNVLLVTLVVTSCISLYLPIPLFAQESVSAAGASDVLILDGKDTPNDGGGSIDLKFEIKDKSILDKTYNVIIMRKIAGDGAVNGSTEDYKEVKQLDVSTKRYNDKKGIEDGIPYSYVVKLVDKSNNVLFTSPSYGPFISSPQWYNTEKTAVLILSIISIFIILLFINLAKQGRNLYIRPLAGIKAIEDAVGRATEMGKPCIYIPGISTIDDISTLASISILSKISEVIANYQSRIVIPNYEPIVYSVIDEVVKNAYVKAGRPDAYKQEDVYYLTGRQFAYASGIAGLMSREKPAANFFLGWFMAESLILAEAGAMTGAIQIAGTDSISQIPFFIVACDYTLIGEELYAAGAYMGGDSKLLGGLKGQDYVKLVLMIILVVLFFLKLAGVEGIDTLLVGGGGH
ncbi:MAG: hypothetical protein HQK49_03995 [Oligoflexia bacterium]|nr:hypothetical protein [Oligoflexia bacterium]